MNIYIICIFSQLKQYDETSVIDVFDKKII